MRRVRKIEGILGAISVVAVLMAFATTASAVPPQGVNQSVTTDENQSVSITLRGTDTDGDSLRFSISDQPDHGSLSCDLTSGCTNENAYNYNRNADSDDGSCRYTSCRQIKLANPGAGDGNYSIDPDGHGPVAALTVTCDMTTDGGGYTYHPVPSGRRTFRTTDRNSCQDVGLEMVVPRTKNHWSAMLGRYGTSYFGIAPGISKPTNGGNYTGFAMKSGSVPDWRAIDGGNWFLRDSRYSEPNGDYTANCWLLMYHFDVNDLRFNDGNCSYSSTRYVCSTNDKNGPENLTNDPSSCAQIKRDNPNATNGNYTIRTPTGQQVTAYCDMNTDGGGYTMVPINSGTRTYRSTDNNSCKNMGLDIVVPRTKEHWRSMLSRFGTSYFSTIPGITKPTNGGNYTGFAMKSGSVPDWRASDDGSWFMRDSPYSEPNGDYHANCWLSQYDWNVDNIRFNDGNCSYSTTRYICSTNDKDGPLTPDTGLRTCQEILKANPNAPSGNYTIHPKIGVSVTAYCDMATDGGGYTSVAITNGTRTYRSTDPNSCKELGLDIVIPRTKKHFQSLIGRFGTSYFSTIPGVTKPTNGGNYTGWAMNSESGIPDWRASDGGPWWLRDTRYSEPNGDYTANCWLSQYDWNIDNIRFNDGNCSYSTTRYVCSSNDKLGYEKLSTVANSCADIKLANPNAATGNYTITTPTGQSVTAYCDMTTDGGGYTMVPINSGLRTYRSTDNDSCKQLGLNIVVPRTKEHWRSMLSRFGNSYFGTIPGISKPTNGGNYTGYAMRSGSVPDWRALDGGSWWMRDSRYSEPNGDYHANCWLSQYDWNVDNIRFNDGNCSYSTTRYLCSTNDKDGPLVANTGFRSCAEIKRDDPNAGSGNYSITTKTGRRVTAYCDMTTDGGGYTMVPINSGTRTYRVSDFDTCRQLGLQMVVPRTKEHYRSMINRYGNSYFAVYPGVYNIFNGGNYTGYIMRSQSVPNWRGIDGGSWWMRDSTYSEPNGDYVHGCWLSQYDWNPDNVRFNDGNCSYSTTRYICSTNDKDGDINLPKSCMAIKLADPNSPSGDYAINPGRGRVTVYCDMTTDGGGYTVLPINSGLRTYRSTDDDSCKRLGMTMIIPRTKDHYRALIARYGTSYFGTIPGISKPHNGGNYTGFAMRYGAVPDWQAGDGGSWFMRDSPYSEPNGDYHANCWLSQYDWNPDNIRFNDGNCSYSTTRYLCSTNDKDPHPDFQRFQDQIDQPPVTTAVCTYTPTQNYHGTDVFDFRVTDPSGTTGTGRVNITINSVNEAPVSNSASVSVNEDATVNFTLGATDSDGDSLTYTIVTNPQNGTLTGTAPNLTYRPSTNFNGSDSLVFRTNDGTVNSGNATVTFTVNPVNDAPVANALSASVNEDNSVNITLTGSDVDGNNLTFQVVGQPGNGAVTCNGASCSYSPSTNFNGTDTFTYRANDGTLNSANATVTVTVNPVNDAPVANALSASVNEDNSVNITLTGSDVDGDNLTFALVGQPGNGSVTCNGASCAYSPSTNFSGTDTFTYRANDGTVNSANATVTVTVNPINDAPVATTQSVEVNEDNSLSITLTGTDVDGDNLTFQTLSNPSHGTLSCNGANCTYNPSGNYNGTDSFLFRANDGTVNSGNATININVRSVNDTPVANAGNISTNEDTNVSVILTGTDADGDDLTYEVVTQPGNGTLQGQAPNLLYRPDANFNGTDTVVFRVGDGVANSANATITITVNPVNDAPVANAQSIQTNEDTPSTLTLTGSDVDGDNITFSVLGQPGNGSVTCAGANCTYQPAANFNGTDSFLFRVNDGNLNSAPAQVTVTVNAINDQPVANAQNVTTNEDTARNIILTGSDLDGNDLTFEVLGNTRNGALTGQAPNLTYTPGLNFNGSDSLTFRVNDGTVNSTVSTVTITVNAVNDAPVAQNLSLTTPENTALVTTLLGSDVDGDDLTFTVQSDPSHGTITGQAPNITYTPDNGYLGLDSFTYRVSDGSAFAEGTISLTVRNPDLDPPIVAMQTSSIWFGTGARLQFHLTDTRCQTPPTLGISPQTISVTLTDHDDGGWQVNSQVLGQGRHAVTITATSRCSSRTTTASQSFGVDTTRPLIIYNELPQNNVDVNDMGTWPVKSLLEELGMTALLRDTLSGMAHATATLISLDRNNEERSLHDGDLTARSGSPPTGLLVSPTNLCSNVQHCNNGRLRLEPLQGDRFILRLIATDVAGNERTVDHYFRVARLRPSIVAWQDALDNLSSNNSNAEAARLAAIAKLDVALEGFDNNYFGNMIISLEDAEALTRQARAFDTDIDTREEALLVADLAARFFVERVAAVRNEHGDLQEVRNAENFLDEASVNVRTEASGDAMLSSANSWFWMEVPRVDVRVSSFADTLRVINAVIGEMDTYITHDPQLTGRLAVADARTELGTVRDFIVRVVDQGDTSLSDLEHVRLLLGLTNTAEDVKISEDAGVWVRNWQWALTQIVQVYAQRGLTNAHSQLQFGSRALDEGDSQMERASVHRENAEADDYMTLLINSRCLILGLYNLAYDPDEAVLDACCEDIIRYNGLDNRVPVPNNCR